MPLAPLSFSSTTHPELSVLRALVLAWGRHVGINLTTRASRMPYTGPLLDSFSSEDPEKTLKGVGLELSWQSLKSLEASFEALLTKDHRRKHGAVYTPLPIVQYLVTESVEFLGRTPRSFCDPACGAGGFLLAAADLLIKRGCDPVRVFSESIVGVDRNPTALQCSAVLLELFLLQEKGLTLEEPLNLHHLDTLIAGIDGVRALSPNRAGFDVLATNPPYVKLQTLDASYRPLLTAKYPHLVKGSFSLANLFLFLISEATSPDGVSAIITQNNLFTSLSAEPLRRHLQNKQCLRRVIDFGHQQVFSRASAYTCLLFIQKHSFPTFEYGLVDQSPSFDLLRGTQLTSVSLASLDPRKWRLGRDDRLAHLKRIESIGMPLGSAYDIRVGFATLKDKVFLLGRDPSSPFAATDVNGNRHEIEPDLTRDAIRIADLTGGQSPANVVRKVVFPYRRKGQRFRPLSEDEFKADFPRGFEYLEAQRELLSSRSASKGTAGPWYAWGRSQGMQAPGPKLLTKTFDRGPHFYLDSSDALLCNGYGVFPASLPRLGVPALEALLLLLNSKVMYYFAVLTSFQIAGGYQCYQKNFIDRFGVPLLTPIQEATLLSAGPGDREELIADLYGIPMTAINERLDLS